MWDFLKKGVQKGLEYGTDLLNYRTMILQMLEKSSDDAASELYAAVMAMDETGYSRFTIALNSMIANTSTDLQQYQTRGASPEDIETLNNRLELLKLYAEYSERMWQQKSGSEGVVSAETEPETFTSALQSELQESEVSNDDSPEAENTASPEEQAQTLVETLEFMSKLGANSDDLLLSMAESLVQIEIHNRRYTRERKKQVEAYIERVKALQTIQDPGAKARQIEALTREFIDLTQSMPPEIETVPRQAPQTEGMSDERQAEINRLFQLRQELENDLATGQIAPERGRELRMMLNELDEIFEMPRETAQDNMIFQARTREILARLSSTIVNLGYMADPESDTYAGYLARCVRGFGGLVLKEGSRITALTDSENKVLASIQGRINEISPFIESNPGDDELLKLEKESLRALALDVHKYTLRHHLMIANPIWSSSQVFRNPNAVFYAGDKKVSKLMGELCTGKGLQLLTTDSTGKDPAQERWNQLRLAHVAVFDLTNYVRYENLDTGSREEITGKVAAVSYDLGIAFTLGLPVVIVGEAGQAMPFDLDIEPIRLTGDSDSDAGILASALDEAIYTQQREELGNAIPAAVDYVRRIYGSGTGNMELEGAVSMLDDAIAADPLKVKYLLDSILLNIRTRTPQIIFPPWVASYPDSNAPRCFHITAFRPHLEIMRTVLSEHCEKAGIQYIRGDDEVLDPQIIVSIWDNICRASHVVVDVTDFNPNAVLELAMAHVLGRKTIVFSQNFEMLQYVPALGKIRILPYSADNTTVLHESLEQFLAIP